MRSWFRCLYWESEDLKEAGRVDKVVSFFVV